MSSRTPKPPLSDAHAHSTHDHSHGPDELHAGSDHSHPHDHGHDHGDGHAHDHDHWHAHEHTHADGTTHAHPHAHSHAHAHDHGHAHGHDHAHGHGDFAGDLHRLFAAAGTLSVLVREFPGAGAAAILGALGPLLGAPLMLASPLPGAGLRLPGKLEDGIDAHALLHALEHAGAPKGGVLALHASALAHAPDRKLARHMVLVVDLAAAADLPAQHPSLMSGVELIVVSGTAQAAARGLDAPAILAGLREAAPGLGVIGVAMETGAGLDKLAGWLKAAQALARAAA